MKIRIYAVLVGAAIGIVSGTTIANVNDKMAQMFGAQSNFTKPGTAEGALRGVLTGGRMTVRTPIVTASGFSFEPPGYAAGCGGIDMYGGNLSFPSKEQYIATARAVVGNVGGYAFKSAMKYVCEACESVMSAIQDTVQMLNVDNMNSCQIAQGVVDGVKDGTLGGTVGDRGRQVAAKWKEASGQVSDWFEGFKAGKGTESPAQDAAKAPEMAKIMGGNWTWDSMLQTKTFDWLGSDKQTREEILSLLGTVVTCTPGVNGCPGEEGGDPKPLVYSPRLKLQDFIAPEGQASDQYWVYTCQDDACMNVNTNVQRKLGATVTQKIIDTLLGKEGQPGVLERMTQSAQVAGNISPEEKALVNNSFELVNKAVVCMNAGEQGRGYARTYVEGLAPQMAADALFRAIDQSIPRIIEDLNQRGEAVGAAAGLEMIKTSHAELRVQYEQIKNLTVRNDMLMEAINRCSKSPIASVTYGTVY